MKLMFTVPANLSSSLFEELGPMNYLYDGVNLLEEVDNNANVLARYTQGPLIDEPMAQLRSGSANYFEIDAIGTVTC